MARWQGNYMVSFLWSRDLADFCRVLFWAAGKVEGETAEGPSREFAIRLLYPSLVRLWSGGLGNVGAFWQVVHINTPR